MCADILIALGYEDVVLNAPRGGSDGGMDITFKNQRGEKGLACVTLRKDIKVKFKEDFSQRRAGEFDIYILFCTKYLTHKQKVEFAKYCLETLRAEFVPKDIEALRSLLDSSLKAIRETYLHIQDESKGVSQEAFEALRKDANQRSLKDAKRERLQSSYQVLLNAADSYQFEAQQINHIASPANISLTGVDEAVNEISLEDVDTDVLSIFFDLRGAFNEFTARLHMPEEGTWEEVLKHKHKIIAKFDELKTTMKRRLKELES